MAVPLIDFTTLDLTRNVLPEAELRTLLPHRHEFQLIDGVCHIDIEKHELIAYKDWDENAWWARGHVPGRPLMPGVLMCEGAAQAASLLSKKRQGWGGDKFIGLGGLDNVRFRGQVVPPARCYFVTRGGVISSRLAKYPAQCVVDGKVCLEMELLGVLL